MDVFNGLEDVRQYFQGLPAATSSTASSGYQQQPNNGPADTGHDRSTAGANVPYWPPQHELQSRPPTRESTPQRPASHHSDSSSSRPPSHHNIQHANDTKPRSIQAPAGYAGYANHEPQQPQQQQQQTFQFSVPHSREAPSNAQQQHQQQQVSYQSHILPNPSYHQSQQQPPPQQMQATQRSSTANSQSYHQLQPPQNQAQQTNQNYNNYNNRSYYSPTVPNNSKSAAPLNTYKTASTTQSYNFDAYKTYPSQAPIQNVSHPPLEIKDQSLPNHNAQQQHKSTHNLPPIAALSNYHTGRSSRETLRIPTASRPNKISTTISATPRAASHSPVKRYAGAAPQAPPSTSRVPPPPNNQPMDPYCNTSQYSMSNYHSSSSYYTAASATSSSSNNNCYAASYQQSSASRASAPPAAAAAPPPKANPQQQYQQHPQNASGVDSVLDLSLKTIKTPADSTLDDSDENQRNGKYYARQQHNPNPARYPESYTNNQRNVHSSRQSAPQPSASAPKVDFLPNFNMPMNQNYKPESRQAVSANSYEKMYQQQNHQPSRHHQQQQFNAAPMVPNNAYGSNNPGKKPMEGLPRIDFPPTNQAQKTGAYHQNTPEATRKRSATQQLSTVVQNKRPRMDDRWRQVIDKQIEQKFSSYQSAKPAAAPSAKDLVANGGFLPSEKNTYQPNQYPVQAPHHQYSPASTNSQYHQMNQTYVPSAAAHHYPSHITHGQQPMHPQQQQQQQQQHHQQQHHQQQHAMYQQNLNRSNSHTSLNSTNSNNVRSQQQGADKRIISILRSNLEMKGAKEAQKKMEQSHIKTYDCNQRPREVQHPSTDVTAPLQPKHGIIGRQNVSPFTAASLVERSTPPTYKFPKAVDSVRFEEDKPDQSSLTNQAGDLDGLAANLAARIRTKGELKQVSQTQHVANYTKHTSPGPGINETASLNGGHPNTSVSKDKTTYAPRRRLFSRNEEDQGEPKSNVPPRDKTGLRSSSETSVFDFPDSGDESEVPVSERQSLEDMRRDRKSISKQSLVNESDFKEEVAPIESPIDDIFNQVCDNFVDQLMKGSGKKRGRRKKEDDVSENLQTARKKKLLTTSQITDDSTPPVNAEEVIWKEEIPEAMLKEELQQAVPKEEIQQAVPKEEIQESVLKEEMQETVSNDENQQETPKDEIQEAIPEKNIEEPKPVEAPPKMEEESDSDVPLSQCKKSIATSESVSTTPVKEEISINESTEKMNCTSEISSESEGEGAKSLGNKRKTRKLKEPIRKMKELNAIREISSKLIKKPAFGDGSDFYPGWEEELYKYKKALRIPRPLIQVTRPPNCHRLSTSLPDLDPCPSPTPSSVTDVSDFCKFKSKTKSENFDSDMDSNSSFNFTLGKNYDSEEGGSVRSLSVPNKIMDRLLERYGGRKRKRLKKKEQQGGPKVIPKSDNALELLPTPSLEIREETKKSKARIIKSDSIFFGFRKKTVDSFKDTFIKNSKTLVGVSEQFTTVVLKSRTRTETRVLKQKATIREVFGEDRPASAPPVTCLDELKDQKSEIIKKPENTSTQKNSVRTTKEVLKNKILKKKTTPKKTAQPVPQPECEEKSEDNKEVVKQEVEAKSETPSLDGEENIANRKRSKFRNIRRKGSSGFDYIRKKKKQVKKESSEPSETAAKNKRRSGLPKTNLDSVQDIQKEIKSWVLNKGIGETHLHRSARLGYTDITAYCLEKMQCSPSPKDNAGYTPLHEACSRGHLEIAKLLLMYGANASESAQGGIRPLHEAAENGYVEIVRLLLSYGADPNLATYSGSTPLSLATDESTISLLKNHVHDIQGLKSVPWNFYGPASCFDSEETGYDPLESPPVADPLPEDEDMDFEVSEVVLPNLYTLAGESPTDRWVLLQDLSSLLKIKSKDALLRQINPPAPSTSSSTSSAGAHKSILRELKMADFLEKAHCCQFMNAGEKINCRASKVALVKYTEKVRQLLNVEKVLITAR